MVIRYCVRFKRAYSRDIAELASRIGNNVFIGNPITAWVDSDKTLEQIESLPYVDVAVVSVTQEVERD